MNNLLILMLLPFFAIGQNNHVIFSTEESFSINKILDSTINNPIHNHSTLLYILKKQVIIDTLTINKIKLLKKDSSVLVKYSNKSENLISTNSLWGLITDFGERRRFFKGKSYTIWHTKTPYIYKTFNSNLTTFYFSETLLGNIFPLTSEKIDNTVSNSQTKDWLNNYIIENKLQASNCIKNNSGELLSSSLDFLSIVNEIIEACIRTKQNHRLYSNTK